MKQKTKFFIGHNLVFLDQFIPENSYSSNTATCIFFSIHHIECRYTFFKCATYLEFFITTQFVFIVFHGDKVKSTLCLAQSLFKTSLLRQEASVLEAVSNKRVIFFIILGFNFSSAIAPL